MIDALSPYIDWISIAVITFGGIFITHFGLQDKLFSFINEKQRKTYFILFFAIIVIIAMFAVDYFLNKKIDTSKIWPRINGYFISTSFYELIVQTVMNNFAKIIPQNIQSILSNSQINVSAIPQQDENTQQQPPNIPPQQGV